MTPSTEPTVRALWAESRPDGGVVANVRALPRETLVPQDLTAGDVLVRVTHSSVNYKDGLAVLGRPGVVRSYPIVPGIDVVGVVESSAHPRWTEGSTIVANGAGLGELRHGGFAELTVVPGDYAVPVPDSLGPWAAAAVGTAGYTAALSVIALQRAGVAPGDGDVVVTGAAGGVGTIAIALLSRAGYRVVASTGRVDEHGDSLRALGAAQVIHREELAAPGRPLQKARFSGGIDSVGGATLANVVAQTEYSGAVTCCGMAQSTDLPSSVLPFILRAVNLIGIDSVQAPLEKRQDAWDLLSSALDVSVLEANSSEIGLAEVNGVAEGILSGQIHGRTVVSI